MNGSFRLAVRWICLVLMLFVAILMFDTDLRFFYQAF